MIYISIPSRIHTLASFLLISILIVVYPQCSAAEKSNALEKSVANSPPVISQINALGSENYTNRLGIKSIFIGDSFDNVTALRSIKTRCSINLEDAKAANGDSPEISRIREQLKLINTEKYQSCIVDGVATVGGLNVWTFKIEFFDNKALRIIVTFEDKYPEKLKYDERSKLRIEKLTAFLDAMTLQLQTPFTEGKWCRGGSCRGIGGGTHFTRYIWQRRDGRAEYDDPIGGFATLTISSPEGDSRSAAKTAEIDKMRAELRARKEYEQNQKQQLKKSNTARAIARDL